MSQPARIRVLHLVRTALPDGVVEPGDVVVYSGPATEQAGSEAVRWLPAMAGELAMSSQALCELIFAADRVVVW